MLSKPSEQIQAKIDALTLELTKAQRAEALFDNNQDIRVATLLHHHLCTQNHTDGCDWLYNNWENYRTVAVPSGSSRATYRIMAGNLLNLFSEEQIEEFMRTIKPKHYNAVVLL